MKKNINLKKLTIAHRGLYNNKDIPENSLKAFLKALKENYPIELDVQLTKDNQLAVFHDNRVSRMTTSKQLIQDTTLEELQKLTLLDTNERIPTLSQVLKMINGNVLIDIEIKSTDRVEEIGKVLSKELKKYKGDILIKSFNPSIIHWFKTQEPTFIRGLLITDYHNKIYNHFILNNTLLKYCEPNFLAVSKKMASKKKIQNYRKKYPIFLWTIEKQQDLDQYKELGDSFICNQLPY